MAKKPSISSVASGYQGTVTINNNFDNVRNAFGNVAVEAQGCGTPVITTDWGAFTETVEHGKTGFRCRTLSKFIKAAEDVSTLDPYYIRQRAIDLYSLDVIGNKYEKYFIRLLKLWDKGWYG